MTPKLSKPTTPPVLEKVKPIVKETSSGSINADVFATVRYTCEVIPKIWVNKCGMIKDSSGVVKLPYPSPKNTVSNQYHLRKDPQERLQKLGDIPKIQPITDRFLLTSTGSAFATPAL